MRALPILIIAIGLGGCRLGFDGACGAVDSDTLALYTMDDFAGGVVADRTGDHPGMLVGDSFAQSGSCGGAFSSASGAVIVVPDSPDWDLDQGSVELRAEIPAAVEQQGLISRDANGTAEPGHLTLFLTADQQLVARLQNGGDYYRCTPPIEVGRTVRIAISFGPAGFELAVDGEPAGEPEAELAVGPISCGEPTADGIAGNQEPWVIGAGANKSDVGEASPLDFQFAGVIDEVRISRVQRPL